MLKKNADKLAKAQDEQDFAAKIAERLSEAYKEHISSGNLPNGKMYYNIAKRIIPPTMTDSYQQISDYCYAAQSALNENAGISIKAQRAPINTDRIDGIVNRVSQEPFDEIDWILKAPIENFCRSVVDDHKKQMLIFTIDPDCVPELSEKQTVNAVSGVQTLRELMNTVREWIEKSLEGMKTVAVQSNMIREMDQREGRMFGQKNGSRNQKKHQIR